MFKYSGEYMAYGSWGSNAAICVLYLLGLSLAKILWTFFKWLSIPEVVPADMSYFIKLLHKSTLHATITQEPYEFLTTELKLKY